MFWQKTHWNNLNYGKFYFPNLFFFSSLKHWEKLNFHYFQNWVKKYSRSIFKDDNGLKLSKDSHSRGEHRRVLSSFWLKQKSDFPRSTSHTHEFQFSISFLSLSLFPSLSVSFCQTLFDFFGNQKLKQISINFAF